MLRPHAAHGHRLQPADTAIILHADTRKMAHRLGHLVHAQPFHIRLAHDLQGGRGGKGRRNAPRLHRYGRNFVYTTCDTVAGQYLCTQGYPLHTQGCNEAHACTQDKLPNAHKTKNK